jgi:ubiquitin-activating enzyme E1
MVIPFKTECYGDSKDPEEESIAVCTLRLFPNLIEHCIEWGRDLFNRLFVDRTNDVMSYLDNRDLFLAEIRKSKDSTVADRIL